MDPSGSASASRAPPGLSQSSDSHLPKGEGPSLVVIRPVCRGLERGGVRGSQIRASVEVRVPPTRACVQCGARVLFVFRRFAILEPRG